MLEATQDNDFKDTIEVFLKDTEILLEPEDLSDREGVYYGRISARKTVVVSVRTWKQW